MEEHAEELAVLETIDMGAPLPRTRGTVKWISQLIRFFASCTATGTTSTAQNSLPGRIMTLNHRAPLGVVGGIIPWNGPLGGQWWILGPTLATGCNEPTVFSNVSNTMTIAREEIFGPVVSIVPFDTIEEVLRLANDTEYGLGGGVWTRDLSTAHKVSQGIRSGVVWVNCYGLVDPAVGFGGCKISGYGWKGSMEHVESFLSRKAV